jgi:hypothetical protein
MVHRVLVLCQRKSSEGPSRTYVSSQVKGIQAYIDSFLPNAKIEYLTTISKEGKAVKNDADHTFTFTATKSAYPENFAKTKKFTKHRSGKYSMILLHTCPFAYLQDSIPLLAKLLKPFGKLVLTTYNSATHEVHPLSETIHTNQMQFQLVDEGNLGYFFSKHFDYDTTNQWFTKKPTKGKTRKLK